MRTLLTDKRLAFRDDNGAAPDMPRPSPSAMRISCVVCAYNEADKIMNILSAVHRHPVLTEVIVVNDGSTDDTGMCAWAFPGVQIISYMPNRGKTYALSQGIAAATGDYLMLLDADLAGVTAADIQALADPVIEGRAHVSISLRRNSLALYRFMGLDFVSGERVIPARLVKRFTDVMARLPRWGGEAFINSLITRERLSIAVVDWRAVFNIRKSEKLGRWRGVLAEVTMVADVFQVLSPWRVVGQNLAMLRLIIKSPVKVRVAAGTSAEPGVTAGESPAIGAAADKLTG